MGMAAGGIAQVGGSMVGGLFSAIGGVVSGYQQARAARAEGKGQQRLANYNAQVAEVNAKTQVQAGEAALRNARVRAEQIRDSNRYERAKQQVALAKSGVVSSSGTPLLVSSEAAVQSKLQSLDEIWKGRMEKREHNLRAGEFKREAYQWYWQGVQSNKAMRAKAKNYIMSGWSGAMMHMIDPAGLITKGNSGQAAGMFSGMGGGGGASIQSSPAGNTYNFGQPMRGRTYGSY